MSCTVSTNGTSPDTASGASAGAHATSQPPASRSSRGLPTTAAAPKKTRPGTRLRTVWTLGAPTGSGSSAPPPAPPPGTADPEPHRAGAPLRDGGSDRQPRLSPRRRRSGLAPDGDPGQQERVPNRRDEDHGPPGAGQRGGSLLRRLGRGCRLGRRRRLGGPVAARGRLGGGGRRLHRLRRLLGRRLLAGRRVLLAEGVGVLLVARALAERRRRRGQEGGGHEEEGEGSRHARRA